MPHDALVKLLFAVFGENPLWGLTELRPRTEQPKAYLQQVLPEVAEKVNKGSVSIIFLISQCRSFDFDILLSGQGKMEVDVRL